MDLSNVREYLSKMPLTGLYDALSEEDKDKWVFGAYELLSTHYRSNQITARAVALQVLYMLEGEEEEYAKLRRHGVTAFSTNRVSASLNGSAISPEVESLIRGKARVGRLI
ncbi:hypothetical protein CHH65_13845 [Shouchella clausii]|uniref:hypothetical protein n=1 Tax=Shouchella clausii TaxID=79880 RepID=UPI000BA71173|nr:hypothetical protein [Shouchella clausii]PAF08666.1 hypothetical protein CHH65_13845 [Shouchella clausii]